MTVRLVIEHATHPQRETSRTWEGGELVIGRGADAGWQLDDPDQFLSRRHAIVSAIGGVPHVTDASRGGLFVDGAAAPLGPGNSRPLEDGMRLRLGDFVLRVEMTAAARGAPPQPPRAPTLSFEFGPAEPAAPPPARPADLPSPFGTPRPGPFAAAPAAPAARAPRPLDMDDPFALDLRGGARAPVPEAAPVPPPPRPASPFDTPAPPPGPARGNPFDTGGAAPPRPDANPFVADPFDPAPRAAPLAEPARASVPPPADPAPARPVPASSPFATPDPAPAAAPAARRSYFFDDPDPAPAAAPAARPADPFALGAGFRPATPVVEPPPGADDTPDDSDWARVSIRNPAPPPAPAAPPEAAPLPPADTAPATTAPLPPAAPPTAAPAAPEPVAPTAFAPPAFAPPAVAPPAVASPAFMPPPVAPAPAAAAPAPHPFDPAPAAPAPAPGPDLYAAFLRGAGLPPDMATAPADPERAMEDAGRHFRALVDGLMHMLRARALEKQKVRVAQTVMASANVNPLKTLPTAEDGVAALIAPRGPGYLAPGPAIDGAFRDLADHQMRTWTALQSALRRMIDRFDPAEIEAEMEQAGRMKALLAGGRSALLWQLYEDRYREIAQAAEERFLGEVGADFRDAYEGQRRDQE